MPYSGDAGHGIHPRPFRLDGEDADRACVVKRPRPKFFRLRDPEWRADIAVRLGFPVIGVVAGVTFAVLIIKA